MDEIRGLAELARLRLTDDELARVRGELETILGHLDVLAELEDVEQAAEPGATPLRDDEPGADPLHRPPQELAPAWRDGFFTVPRLAAMGGEDARVGGDAGADDGSRRGEDPA